MKKILIFILLFLCFPVWADVLDDTPISSGGFVSFWQFVRAYHISPIFFAMGLTAVIETFLLWCFKYRTWKVLTYFFILNLISNFLVNLGAAELPFYICFTFFNNDCFMYSGGGMLNTVYYYCIPF